MDTMIHCIIHLPGSEPQTALLLCQRKPRTRQTKVKRTRHSKAASRAKLTDEQFDQHCRQIARDEMTRLRLAEEFQEGQRGVARYEARQEIIKVLERAAELEEAAGR